MSTPSLDKRIENMEKIRPIVDMALELATAFNDVNEKNMLVGRYNNLEHISTEEQNAILNAYRNQCITSLTKKIDSLLVDKRCDYQDVKDFESKNGLTPAMECGVLARIVFDIAWIRYLAYHCGERKFGWYTGMVELILESLKTKETFEYMKNEYNWKITSAKCKEQQKVEHGNFTYDEFRQKTQ